MLWCYKFTVYRHSRMKLLNKVTILLLWKNGGPREGSANSLKALHKSSSFLYMTQWAWWIPGYTIWTVLITTAWQAHQSSWVLHLTQHRACRSCMSCQPNGLIQWLWHVLTLAALTAKVLTMRGITYPSILIHMLIPQFWFKHHFLPFCFSACLVYIAGGGGGKNNVHLVSNLTVRC